MAVEITHAFWKKNVPQSLPFKMTNFKDLKQDDKNQHPEVVKGSSELWSQSFQPPIFINVFSLASVPGLASSKTSAMCGLCLSGLAVQMRKPSPSLGFLVLTWKQKYLILDY